MRDNKRHIVNVMRPSQATDDHGQPLPATYHWANVPCSIETIGGSEPEAGGQQQAITTYRVEMYGDPTKPLKHSDYLTLGSRTLNIQAIDDKQQNGTQLTLICGERHDP